MRTFNKLPNNLKTLFENGWANYEYDYGSSLTVSLMIAVFLDSFNLLTKTESKEYSVVRTTDFFTCIKKNKENVLIFVLPNKRMNLRLFSVRVKIYKFKKKEQMEDFIDDYVFGKARQLEADISE